jgi:hypothetical protein
VPYIKPERRDALKWPLPTPKTAGELNYLFTELILRFLGPDPNYQSYNDVIGALECCKFELYRRRVVDYEYEKIQTNGDVY